jgi:hypothetical protein
VVRHTVRLAPTLSCKRWLVSWWIVLSVSPVEAQPMMGDYRHRRLPVYGAGGARLTQCV